MNMSDEHMDLTIIIVNWNGGDLLLRCLESIRTSKTSFQVKTIVVDNDSSDGSREAASTKFPEFDIFNSGANLGFGRANNLARSRVKTPLVLFLNPDTELKENSLEIAVQSLLTKPDVGALGCKMLYPNGKVQDLGLQWSPSPWKVLLELLLANRKTRVFFRRWLPVVDPLQSSYVRKIYGGFVLARKEVLDQAGWFDDRYFMYAEDVDLSHTILELGWKLYYSSKVEIVHVCGGVTGQAPSGFAILMKNESISKYIGKYQGQSGEFLYRISILVAALIRLSISLPLGLVGCFHLRCRRTYTNLWLKQKLMILWALGLKNAKIATSRGEGASAGDKASHLSRRKTISTVPTAS